MSLPTDKGSDLKRIIRGHLVQMNIHDKIRSILTETREDLDPGFVSEGDLLRALEQRGVVDDVMKELTLHVDSVTEAEISDPPNKSEKISVTHAEKINIDLKRRYLNVQILGGKAFLEHLQEPDKTLGGICSTLTLCLGFCNQRFRSKPVPCACEPDLQESFLLEVHQDATGNGNKMADSSTMLSMCDPIHMVLIKTDTSGDTVLTSSHFLDWRTVLCAPHGRTSIAIELLGVGSECKVPIGVLNVKLELYPPLVDHLSVDVITTQQSLERQKTAEKERLFLVYAKQWWREFLAIRPSNQNKLVKIFAQDENGLNRPVCSYVHILRGGRLLESPRQAARFVSLLAQERVPVVGGGSYHEQWCTMMAFLCRNKGDCEDHATLLCSLLLGFGLDAYVCVGTKARNNPHVWVMTCGTDGTVTFWESLTGNRYLHRLIDPDDLTSHPKPSYPYQTVGCVFNQKAFFANCQPTDSVPLCVFDLEDKSCWKAMSEEALNSVCASGSITSLPPVPTLCSSSLDPVQASNQMELELRHLLAEHRKDLGLATIWDDNLSYLLSAALVAYELERCTGVSCGNEEFQDAVRRAVPDGHTFKGFPIQFLHHNTHRAFATCLRSHFCEEIVCCRGDHVRLAVRVRVFVYPESACATWVMFACKYHSIL
ncbi:centrosomal protein of 76 kDa [Alosa sapidissima]|uniref:centrosomal protein of 76 kDa n=1 Tax=Alosa sapidissima TaxID=34773 RepID=UPI001C0A3162|nr:centrosomal protein of 76 kDa [Alosa sapidissima]